MIVKYIQAFWIDLRSNHKFNKKKINWKMTRSLLCAVCPHVFSRFIDWKFSVVLNSAVLLSRASESSVRLGAKLDPTSIEGVGND